MIVTQKQGPHGLILVISDTEIVGKYFHEGKAQLDLRKAFYQGEEKKAEEVRTLMGRAQHLHLTGKETVALGVALGFVEAKRILYVDDVPHAEVVMMG